MSETEPKPVVKPPVEDPVVPIKEPIQEPVVEVVIDKDNLTISKKAWNETQKTILALQKGKEEADAKAIETERLSVYSELMAINPKLAKLNEKSSIDMLRGALQAAKEIKEGFPSLNNSKKGETKKASYGDHDSMDYNFVKKEYEFK